MISTTTCTAYVDFSTEYGSESFVPVVQPNGLGTVLEWIDQEDTGLSLQSGGFSRLECITNVASSTNEMDIQNNILTIFGSVFVGLALWFFLAMYFKNR